MVVYRLAGSQENRLSFFRFKNFRNVYLSSPPPFWIDHLEKYRFILLQYELSCKISSYSVSKIPLKPSEGILKNSTLWGGFLSQTLPQ